jgi:hypothetical protein
MDNPRRLEESDMTGEQLTPAVFERIARTQLLVRATVDERLPNRPREGPNTFTRIFLFSASRDTDRNEFFYLVGYGQSSLASYNGSVGLEVHPYSATGIEREPELTTVIDGWSKQIPTWVLPKPVVTCHRDKLGLVREIPASSLPLLQHYARLQTRIAYEIAQRHPGSWMLSLIYSRLESFIKAQNEQWRRTVGPLV